MLRSLIILCAVSSTIAGNTGYNYPKPSVSTAFHAPAPQPHHTGHLQHQQQKQQKQQATQEYEKHFYHFAAPQEPANPRGLAKPAAQSVPAVKKNLNVVFIQTPENNNYQQAAVNLAKAASEEKTHVYVLQKQPDSAATAKRIQAAQQTTKHQPEVHFVKYRTSADAQHAQQTITQHYTHGSAISIQPGSSISSSNNLSRAYLAPVQTAQSGQPNRAYLAPVQTAHTAPPSRGYLAPKLLKSTTTTDDSSAEASNAQDLVAPAADNTPVDKGYARNFLPTDIDVVPGSSYIPLTLRRT